MWQLLFSRIPTIIERWRHKNTRYTPLRDQEISVRSSDITPHSNAHTSLSERYWTKPLPTRTVTSCLLFRSICGLVQRGFTYSLSVWLNPKSILSNNCKNTAPNIRGNRCGYDQGDQVTDEREYPLRFKSWRWTLCTKKSEYLWKLLVVTYVLIYRTTTKRW